MNKVIKVEKEIDKMFKKPCNTCEHMMKIMGRMNCEYILNVGHSRPSKNHTECKEMGVYKKKNEQKKGKEV